MSWLHVLASPAGRIDRKTYNIAAIVPLGLMIGALVLIAFAAFGWTNLGPDHFRWGFIAPTGLSGWIMRTAGLLAAALSLWSSLALCAKRLHDRDKTGWWMSPWMLAAAIVLVPNAAFTLPFGVRMVALAVAVVGFAAALWHTFELSFMRGTPGDNRFGPPAQA